jgi:hypothetical protein
MVGMLYKQDISNCFADVIGGVGIGRQEFEALCERAGRARLDIGQYENGRAVPLLDRVMENGDIAALQEA